MQPLTKYTTDVLVIGSGVAELSLALRLAGYCEVMVLSKGPLDEGSTLYAQGGIAAVFDETDSVDSHVEDTLSRRRRLQPPPHPARRGRDRQDGGNYIGQQSDGASGHSDFGTLQRGGSGYVRSHRATGYPAVVGAYIWNRAEGGVGTVPRAVVLATGGASKFYQYTTNPDISSGDGIAMTWRAGCQVANLEFNQFHPTCLFHLQARNFLLTEALGGEGAYLRRLDGSRLAPRDIVARAIDHEMKQLGADCMYLDISHRPEVFIRQHLPTIYDKLLTLDIDLTRQPTPIVSAAHYTCGGVMVDKHGRTNLDGLYAIGEVSYTGLHGTNRLASNSLLECLVYGWLVAEDILRWLPIIAQVRQLPL